ncbi:hypothetical protein HELRODRAFT_154179 [Helobdella robusta]|uniref:Innexin n=1 Tax=Helobdella robusta TaxID=6412 RepID=T1ELD9_HELRO|nr:hypothetical protein HELRODRAFT_154179 [Helobdella robusta]ESN99000.1 hypothetical protein HELRODRAFT_154179 [Helobdella robusta]
MDKISGVIGSVSVAKGRSDDDFSDRLSYRFTTSFLIVFAILVTTKQFVGDPIQCWVPAHFTMNHEEYTNDYCWIRNTYYLPYDEYVPKEHEREKRQMIPYYQWMPLILLVQALNFYLPILQWRTFNKRSGVDVNNIVEAGKKFIDAEHVDKRNSTLEYMAHQMDRYLSSQNIYKTECTLSLKHLFTRICCKICGRNYGNYLVTLYISTKILVLINVIGQLFLLDTFLGIDFHIYGLQVLASALRGEDWTISPRFPRTTMCDFKVRRLGNVQRYTVQCVLPINLFNEKIYLFLWFWMVFVALMTSISLATWILRVGFRIDRHRYIKKHLKLMNKLSKDWDKRFAINFVDDYLRQDGVFVMRLVGHNTNALTVTEFVCCLWDHYKAKCLTQDTSPEKKVLEVDV